MQLESWQWLVAILGALLIGLSKTGVAGIGVLAVGLFALIFPAKNATGIVLPILIAADIVAVLAFRRHAVWSHLWRLMPWAAAGIIIGYFAMDHINNQQVAWLVGAILIVMVVLHFWRQNKASKKTTEEIEAEEVPNSIWFAASVGLMAGFTTMIANAAGPIMILFLLAMRLPKMEFIGTGAWYFLILNCFKVPFGFDLGIINMESLIFDLKLAPFAMAGALFGRSIIRFINQKLFENLALAFTVIAAIKLLLS